MRRQRDGDTPTPSANVPRLIAQWSDTKIRRQHPQTLGGERFKRRGRAADISIKSVKRLKEGGNLN